MAQASKITRDNSTYTIPNVSITNDTLLEIDVVTTITIVRPEKTLSQAEVERLETELEKLNVLEVKEEEKHLLAKSINDVTQAINTQLIKGTNGITIGQLLEVINSELTTMDESVGLLPEIKTKFAELNFWLNEQSKRYHPKN